MGDDVFEPPKAVEIVGVKENWINSQPLTIESLRGQVVLLDFWAFSCVNCLRTIDSLKEIWAKHKDRNFMLIGIHTPEFEFEKNIFNLKMAVRKLGIEYPVLSDPGRINWKNYGNSFWPRAALINPEGFVVFDHVGEIGYDEIDRKIIELVAGDEKILSIHENPKHYPFFMSKELYAGRLRNPELGSVKICTKESCDEYYDPGNHKEGIIYLKGDWKQENEYLEFRGTNGYVLLRFNSKQVNAVLDGSGHVEILYHGETLDPDYAGKDVIFKRGKSFVTTNGPRLYNLIELEKYMPGDIKLIPFKGFRIYSYTFG
jgi:thiol-disulfide isomerase/thioredoxin